MEYLKVFTTLYSASGKLAAHHFTRKLQRHHQAEAASRLSSILDRYIVACGTTAEDNGYPDYIVNTGRILTHSTKVKLTYPL